MPEEATTQVQGKEGVVAEQTTETTTALEDFEWDDGSGDFFGIEGSAIEKVDEVKEVIKEVIKDDTPVATTTTETAEKEEEEEDEDFFGIVEKPDGTVTTKEVEEGGVNYYSDTFAKMKKEGIFQNVEDLEEGEELTQEKFIELQDNEVESRVDEAFEGFFSELDEDAAAFLKHKKEGGSTQDFFRVYGKSTGAPTGDLDDEVYQEKLARHYYQNIEGGDIDDIDDKIEWLKESGKLEKYAQKFDVKIKEVNEKEKLDLKEAIKAETKRSDEGRLAFVDSVREALDNTDQIENFKFSTKVKKTLLPFITKSTVKVGKNKYITGMQSKLQTALKTPEKMLILAKLLENDFDMTSILADSNTKVTKKLKNDIQRQRTTTKPTGSGRVNKRKNLADFF